MISVCIPTYNGEKFIKEQLSSILNQLGKDDQVVISDDSSTDSTIDIIKSFNDERIILLINNNFKSPIFNLENALKNANGDYIFLSDQDDVWLNNRIVKTLEYLKKYDLVVVNGSIVDTYKNIIHNSYFDWKGSKTGFLKNLYKNSYLGCSLAFNRKILKNILPFPKKIAMHDIWIGLVSEMIGKPYFLDEKLFLYRRHENNVTCSIDKTDDNLSDNSVVDKIRYRLMFIYYLVLRTIFNK